MNRVDRLMGILTMLQSKKFVSGEQIAGRFGISIRTVYRDIKALAEIGIPVSFEAPKGYFIVPGYFLPPVAFSSEEANALVLMESLAGKFGDRSIRQHYESAMHKIKAVLKGSQKERLERLESQIRIYHPPQAGDDFRYLSDIQQAITDRIILRIGYKNNEGRESRREVEPIGLTFYSMGWHLIAWCWERNSYRDFKTSRLTDLKNTGKTFRKNDHIGINDYIRQLE